MAQPRKVRFIVQPHRGADRAIDPGVGDRVRAEAILTTLEELCRELTVKGGWDQPPSLGFLYQRGRTPAGQTEQAGSLRYQRVEVEFSPLPDATPALARAERKHRVLVNLALTMREQLGVDAIHRIVPPNLIAVVLHTETWMLDTSLNAPPEKIAEQRQAANTRTIHEHPDRVEARALLAVDTDFVRYSVMQRRGGELTHLVGTGAARTTMSGDVPNALEYLMWIFQGRDPGDWETWWKTHYDYRDDLDKALDDDQRDTGTA